MKLDAKTTRLIAVGASITANCQQCLSTNIFKAIENGCDEQEINEAIEIGKLVGRSALSKMNKLIAEINLNQFTTTENNDEKCNCGL